MVSHIDFVPSFKSKSALCGLTEPFRILLRLKSYNGQKNVNTGARVLVLKGQEMSEPVQFLFIH